MSSKVNKNFKMFNDLLSILSRLSSGGVDYNDIIIRSTGTRISFHSTSSTGMSMNMNGPDDLAFMVKSGNWILTARDAKILAQQLSYFSTDRLHFIDLKTNGWLQVLFPEVNQLINIRLWSYTKFQLWVLSLFNSQLRLLRSRL
jgi:hypothetical protein